MKGYKIPEGWAIGWRNAFKRYPKDSEYAWGMNAVLESIEAFPLEELDENPWHTGTPTEGGLFLVLWNDTEEPMRRYSILHWNEYNGTWYDEETPYCNWGDEYHAEVIAWMPITPYEEKENGHAD